MKLLTWNCNGRDYGRCADAIDRYAPDVQVLSEVLDIRGIAEGRSVWSGPYSTLGRRKKGVGIVVRDGLSVKRLTDGGDPTCVVARIDGLENPLHVVGVWSRRPYEKPTASALVRAREILDGMPFVAAGDFNSNAYPKWIRKRSFGFRELIHEIEGPQQLSSAYHAFNRVAYGAEAHPTFFWYHRQDRPYHIDFVFVPRGWISRIATVNVPDFEELAGWSDHRPVIVELAGVPSDM